MQRIGGGGGNPDRRNLRHANGAQPAIRAGCPSHLSDPRCPDKRDGRSPVSPGVPCPRDSRFVPSGSACSQLWRSPPLKRSTCLTRQAMKPIWLCVFVANMCVCVCLHPVPHAVRSFGLSLERAEPAEPAAHIRVAYPSRLSESPLGLHL